MSDHTRLRRALIQALADVDPLELRDTGIDLRSEYELEADHVAGRVRLPCAEAVVAERLREAFAELMETELGEDAAREVARRALAGVAAQA